MTSMKGEQGSAFSQSDRSKRVVLTRTEDVKGRNENSDGVTSGQQMGVNLRVRTQERERNDMGNHSAVIADYASACLLAGDRG